MSSPSLAFLFNMLTDKESRYIASTIQFGSGLEGFEVLLGKAPHVITKVTASNVQEPSSQFDLNDDHDFPSLKKMKVNSTLATPAATITKGKEILYENDSVNDLTPSYPVFEVGSSSKPAPLTRSQRRNRRRRELRAQKAESVKLASAPTTSLMKDESMKTSSHLKGSRFYPLFATNATERKSNKLRSESRSLPFVGGRRLPTVASELRTRATVTSLRRIDVISETPRLQSSVRQGKVWKPKGANQVSSASARSSHPREIPKSRMKIDSPKSNTSTEVRQGPPVDLKVIKGNSVEGTLKKLRLDIVKLSEEQQRDVSDINVYLSLPSHRNK